MRRKYWKLEGTALKHANFCLVKQQHMYKSSHHYKSSHQQHCLWGCMVLVWRIKADCFTIRLTPKVAKTETLIKNCTSTAYKIVGVNQLSAVRCGCGWRFLKWNKNE